MSQTGATGSLDHAAVSVATTATAIVASKSGRSSLIVTNAEASAAVFVGGSGVTTANGIKVAAGASVTFNDFNGPLYGIVATGTGDVRYLQVF